MSSERIPRLEPVPSVPATDLGRLRFDRLPFGLAPEADLLFWTQSHRDAAESLRLGIDHGAPVILLTGDIGTGKTTLVQDLLTAPRPDLTTGLLSYIGVDRGDVCARVLLAFGRAGIEGAPMALFAALTGFSRAERDAGRRCVLIVDEAHCATDDELESLRQLTNPDAGGRALLQVVLVGQPDLRARLGSPRQASLVDRIGADAHLHPMSADETAGYIRHRLARAGGIPDAFAPDALAELHRLARGVPRRTNLLCDLCLTEATRLRRAPIDAALVGDVIASARQRGRLAGQLGPEPTEAPIEPGNARPLGDPRSQHIVLKAANHGRPDPARAAPQERRPLPADGGAQATDRAPEVPRLAQREAARGPDRADVGSGAAVADLAPSRADPAAPPADDPGEFRQLAFDAMASLAEYPAATRKPRDDGKKSGGSAPPSKGEKRAAPAPAQMPAPAPASGRRALALSTAAVAIVVAAMGFHMAWSVLDAMTAASTTSSAAAAPGAPPERTPGPTASHADVPQGGKDRAAGRDEARASRPALTTPSLPTVADPEGSADDLFSLALDLSMVDHETAAIAFARAASRGHARAAYYLAQIYETGDGVPRNFSLARAWYAFSQVPKAEARLAALPEAPPRSSVAPPRLLSAARTSDGTLELVWTSATEGNDLAYLVEVLDSARSPVAAQRIDRSSLRLAVPEGDLFWRVTVDTPAGDAASDLQRIPD